MLSSDRLRGWGVSDLPEYKYSRESTGVRIWPGPASKRPSLWPGIFICKGCNASAQSTGKEAAAFCSLQCKVSLFGTFFSSWSLECGHPAVTTTFLHCQPACMSGFLDYCLKDVLAPIV